MPHPPRPFASATWAFLALVLLLAPRPVLAGSPPAVVTAPVSAPVAVPNLKNLAIARPACHVASVSFVSASLKPGATTQGTVTLNMPAPAGGLAVALASQDPGSVSVPAGVTVAQGQSSATFTATAAGVTSPVSVKVMAAGGLAAAGATIAVAPDPKLAGVQFLSASIGPTGAGLGQVSLTAPAPSGGLAVPLTNAAPGAAHVPSSVTVPHGWTSTTFNVYPLAVAQNTVLTVSASLDGVNKSGSTTVNATPGMGAPASGTLASVGVVQVGPGVACCKPAVAMIQLTGPAPAGGYTVHLSSTGPVTLARTSVVVPAAARSTMFELGVSYVSADTPATVTATAGSITKTGGFTVHPARPWTITFDNLYPTAYTPTTGTVTLTGPAPQGGRVVALSTSANSGAGPQGLAFAVPASITVPAGQTETTFLLKPYVWPYDLDSPTAVWATEDSSARGEVTIVSRRLVDATGGNNTCNAMDPQLNAPMGDPQYPCVTIVYPQPYLYNQPSAAAGQPSTATVQLSKAAPPGGMPVMLGCVEMPGDSSYDSLSPNMPEFVTVPAGQTRASFVATATAPRSRSGWGACLLSGVATANMVGSPYYSHR